MDLLLLLLDYELYYLVVYNINIVVIATNEIEVGYLVHLDVVELKESQQRIGVQ